MELCRDERSGSSHRLMAIKSEKFTYPNEASCESCSEEAGAQYPLWHRLLRRFGALSAQKHLAWSLQ
jgi:hypothetical protein